MGHAFPLFYKGNIFIKYKSISLAEETSGQSEVRGYGCVGRGTSQCKGPEVGAGEGSLRQASGSGWLQLGE